MRRKAQRHRKIRRAIRQGVIDLVDEAALNCGAGGEQKHMIAPRGGEGRRESLGGRPAFDQRAARLVRDPAETGLRGPDEHGVGYETLDAGFHQRAEAARNGVAT